MKNLNVLMIIDCYYPIWGGSQSQLRALIPYLEKQNCHITIATRRWKKEYPKLEEIDGINVYRVGLPGTNLISTISYILGLIKFSLNNKGKIDVIHTHGAAKLGALGSFLARLIGVKNIAKISASRRIPQLQKSFLGSIILNQFKKSDKITYMTEEIHEQLKNIKTPSEKTVLLKNGVDTEKFQQLNNSEKREFKLTHDLDTNDIIFIYVGRLVEGKGLETLLNAWEEISHKHQNIQLFLIGTGESGVIYKDTVEHKLKNIVKEKNIKNIAFLGKVENVEFYYGASDVFLFPSESEGMSNCLLEAMSSELAIIASEIGGNQALIEDNQNGLLFRTNDIQSLVENIKLLILSHEKRVQFSKNARETVLKNHSFNAIAQNLTSYFKELTLHG